MERWSPQAYKQAENDNSRDSGQNRGRVNALKAEVAKLKRTVEELKRERNQKGTRLGTIKHKSGRRKDSHTISHSGINREEEFRKEDNFTMVAINLVNSAVLWSTESAPDRT